MGVFCSHPNPYGYSQFFNTMMCSSDIKAFNEHDSIIPRFSGSTIVQKYIQFSKQDSLILPTLSAPVKSTQSSAEQSMKVFFFGNMIFLHRT